MVLFWSFLVWGECFGPVFKFPTVNMYCVCNLFKQRCSGSRSPWAPSPTPAAPASSPGLTLDNQLHVPMLRAGRVADHTAVPAGVLQHRLVKVEAAVCPDGMPAARWELVWAKKNQLGPRAPLRAAKRTPETSLPTSPSMEQSG